MALFLALPPSGSWLGLRFLLAAGGGVGVRLPPATRSNNRLQQLSAQQNDK